MNVFVKSQLSLGLIGWNVTASLTAATGSSVTGTLNTYQLPMYVTQVIPEIYYGGTLQLLNADTTMDKITFQIQNPQLSQAQPFNVAATMSQWYQLGLGQNMRGFLLPENTTMQYTFTQGTATNFTTGNIDLSVAFVGICGTYEQLQSYFDWKGILPNPQGN